ncbi:hypothetical protein OsI_04981 [Oryza sativa Indica Group]|jgi:hypothetical protein|uniref:Uncharacterized protein n=1 Tax=Oryza sativa subsp. indica TaxID=39946 RepID=A2WYI0_ORYSI|nr:hypothetical protein OsI_04981 [Oryza sativa Indica Group]
MVSTMYKEAAATCGDGEHYSRLIRELCALLAAIISPSSSSSTAAAARSPGMSPAAAATMLLGASVALMLCGSVTFAIGLLLMPWVAGVALLFGLSAAVSTLYSGVFGKAAAAASSRASHASSDNKPVLVVA